MNIRLGTGDTQPRLRPDLEWVHRTIRGRSRWIVRDPLTTDFYYFSNNEKAFFDRLDGRTRLDQLLTRRDFDDGFTHEWRRKLLGLAVQHNLLIGHPPGHARKLARRQATLRSRYWRMLPFQLLSIRIPLFDPAGLLRKSTALSRLFFSTGMFWLLSFAGIALVLILIGRWEAVTSHSPDLRAMLSGDRILALALAYLCMKAIHEFGHGLACRRWDAECHEVGIMLLAFTPCLYCDVSDAWKLPAKFPRVMVAAGGIYAELATAIAAGFVWLGTSDGVAHSIAFNVMTVGSITTILVNANPLLRYDGYYMLADMIDVPNLHDQAQEAIWGPFKRWLSGGRLRPMPLDASFPFLIVYAIASMIYRWTILVLVLWGLNQLLKSWGLELIAGLLTATVLIGISISAMGKTRAGLKEVLAYRPARWFRFLSLAVLLAAVLTTAVRVKIRHSVAAIGCAKPKILEPVFATRGGLLSSALPTNSPVAPGDRIATLRSPEDESRIAAARAELAELETELGGLLSRVNDEPSLATSINVLREAIDDRRRQLDSISGEAELFAIVSRAKGTLIEPPWNGLQVDHEFGLTGWAGNPLDLQNLGAWIEQGTLIGWVADLSTWNVEAFVGESDVLEIRVGAAAWLRLDQRPNEELKGSVAKIDPQPLEEVPRTIRGDSRFPAQIRGNRADVPVETTYRVTIELQTAATGLQTQLASNESLASVRIESTPKSFFERSVRYLKQTFRMDGT